MSKPVLYSYFRSSASWRVRIALAYKNIDYEYRPVNLLKSENTTPDYKALNPFGQVPSLQIDGHLLTQSLPIIEYLEETRLGNSLLPEDPFQRAKARQIAEMINSGMQPMQNLPLLNKIAEITGENDSKKEWAQFWINRGFVALEEVLKVSAGQFCVGDTITIADVCLEPQISGAERFDVDISQFPTIQRIHNELLQHESFKKANWKNQPDTPDELKA